MTLAFHVFAVPVLLGYCLFVGISGRLNPISMPTLTQDRASWALGVWIGLAVTVVLLFTIHPVYENSLPSVNELLRPIAFQLVIVITPALALYGFYRFRTDQKLQMPTDPIPGNETNAIETLQITVNNRANFTTSVPTGGNDRAINMPLMDEVRHRKPRKLSAVQTNDNELSEKLKAETSLRKQTETHLRITRKALSVLESETRESHITKSDAQIELEKKKIELEQKQIELEQKLSDSLTNAATIEADAMQEKAKRLQNEQRLLEMKQKIIKAKQEIRRGASARARALSTANKSIAFARQSVEIRTRLESELEQAHNSIDNRQKTINSLVRALDKEKRRTKNEIALVAKQIILHERQVKARRSLEEMARGVENKLTSRLVKKVAKARPSDVKYK